MVSEVFKKAYDCYEHNSALDIISSEDEMEGGNIVHYQAVGKGAVEIILSQLFNSKLANINNILDLPCGHGRVLRHLRAAFPDAKIDACDLSSDGVDFCSKNFDAFPLYSSENLTEVDFPQMYDLIWVGSLFTHTDEKTTDLWIDYLLEQLNYGGLMISTHHGRKRLALGLNGTGLDTRKWENIERQYDDAGYGYARYLENINYGISLSKASKMIARVETMDCCRLVSYSEARWDDHQDVLVLEKSSVSDSDFRLQVLAQHPDFNVDVYKQSNHDLGAAGLVSEASLYKHFLDHGQSENRVYKEGVKKMLLL
jgi:SAM-dependent methyltransferase